MTPTMRAIVQDPGVAHGLRLADVPVPRPGPGQVLVSVEAASTNEPPM